MTTPKPLDPTSRRDLVDHLGDAHALTAATMAPASDAELAAMHHFEHDEGGDVGHTHDVARHDPDARAAAVDALKRCYGVGKRVAATVVDLRAFDHDGLPDDAEPDEVDAVVDAAAGTITPASVKTLVEALSRGRLSVDVRGDGLVVYTAERRPLGRVEMCDLSTWRRYTSPTGSSAEPTGMPSYGGADPVKVARRILGLVQMAPRQHCDACEVLLTGHSGAGGATSLERPWCGGCCASTDVFACEVCGRACGSDDVHDSGSGYWCDACHREKGWDRDPDTHCRRHDNACVSV